MSLLRLPLSDQFVLVWKRDPALDRERLDAEHEADPLKPGFDDAYERACQTQDWSALLKAGEVATLFRFRPLVGRVGQRVRDMVHSGAVGPSEGLGLAFRIALVGIEGWGPPLPKFARTADNDPMCRGLGDMFSLECFNALCERTGNECPESLGLLVLNRSHNLSPPR